MRLFREPIAQFAVLGALLFVLWGVARRGKPDPAATAAGSFPADRSVERRIALGAADIDGLRADFRAAWKREPSPRELGDLVQTLLDEEILFREGMARGLDRGDRLVRRRIVEKMTALARPAPATSDPPRAELERWYRTYPHRFMKPAGVTFEQLFFDPKKHTGQHTGKHAGEGALAAATRARAALGDGPPRSGLGDDFIFPGKLTDRSELELAHLLGEGFAQVVIGAPIGRWEGPVTSRYGVHLVRVLERRPPRQPPFEEVEKQVRADWLTQETRGQRAAAAALLERYELTLPDEVRRTLADVPSAAPYLARAR